MNLSLVLHRRQWELSEFSVTKEELDLAEKHPQGFIWKFKPLPLPPHP